MSGMHENSNIAAAAAAAAAVGTGNVNSNKITDCVQNFIPTSWMNCVLPDAFRYAAVVKQVFIMNAGATVKMRRDMIAGQRNYEALQQYNAWVKNLETCYPHAAINKYMHYTTKSMKKEFHGRDVYRKFCDGLEKFMNVFMPVWNTVLAEGISGKTWPDIWSRFVGKLVNASESVSPENLPGVEFKERWLLCFKFLGPPCEKLFPGQECHELFCEANLQSSRGTGSRKRKIQKLSRKNEREDYARRTKTALQQAVVEKDRQRGKSTVEKDCMQMHTVMRGVEMFNASRQNEFKMLHQALALYAPEDPRAEDLKSRMFKLLSSYKTMSEQIAEVKHHLTATVDLTGPEPSEPSDLFPDEEIDPIHAGRSAVLAPPELTPNPISPILAATPSASGDAIRQVNRDACLNRSLYSCNVCLFSQLMSAPRFRDRQPYAHFECERDVYVARSHISGYGLFAKTNIRRHSIACMYSGKLVRHAEIPDSNTWIAHIDNVWGIDAQDEKNLSGRWANHSLRNNAKIALPNDGILYDGRIKVYCLLIQAIRDICVTEEITVDYSRLYWTIDGVVSPYYYTYY